MNRLLPLLGLLLACTAQRPASPSADTAAVVMAPDDSLVLLLPDSGRVWLTTGRVGTASDGTTCQEHGVRVESRGHSGLVPLLYVRSAPRLEGGHLFATISSNCRPGAVYEIDVATAQPTLVRKGSR